MLPLQRGREPLFLKLGLCIVTSIHAELYGKGKQLLCSGNTWQALSQANDQTNPSGEPVHKIHDQYPSKWLRSSKTKKPEELSQPRGAWGDRTECSVNAGWDPGADKGLQRKTKGI